MATKEDTEDNGSATESSPAIAESDASIATVGAEDSEAVVFDTSPASLGIERYVHAAFFAGGAFCAYLIGKVLAGTWNALAAWPAAVRAVPGLLAYAEDQRPEFTMVIGGLVAVFGTVWLYRKPEVRQWSDDVAAELYKVHWPDRELVTNGTVVVIAASVFATVYIGLLDRIWAFITNLVYGA